MVVCQFHVVSIAVDEPKADAPLVVDGNGVLSLPVPRKFMKPVAWRNIQVVQARRQVKVLKLARRPPCDLRRKTSRLASCIQVLRMPVRERLDHLPNVICHVTRVKWLGIKYVTSLASDGPRDPTDGPYWAPEDRRGASPAGLGGLNTFHTVCVGDIP